MMRSANPALTNNAFAQAGSFASSESMTIQGTVNKTLFLLFFAFLGASWSWGNPLKSAPLMFPALIAGFIVALITIFKKQWSPITAPIYAVIEGVFLGAISFIFEQSYQGIAFQAVGLTFGVLFSLLFAYNSGIIKVSDKFRLGVVAATGGIALFYLISMVVGFFGFQMPLIYQGGFFGIGFSIFVVIIASLNLVLDFDFIERSAGAGRAKYMEWYGAFGLMVTLVWLYLEILRLLSKLKGK
jgi:uncharacterized YccA/Bax inhibitor family protein